MDFTEINRPPQFLLSIDVKEAVILWKIVSVASNNGNKDAEIFVNALYDFASKSNDYTEYL